MRPATLIKKRLWYRHFPVNFVKFLRTPLVAASQYGQITALHEKMSERIIFDESLYLSGTFGARTLTNPLLQQNVHFKTFLRK